jgi:hypothetical protein
MRIAAKEVLGGAVIAVAITTIDLLLANLHQHVAVSNKAQKSRTKNKRHQA